MPIPLPNLDDRRWTDLVDEGRSLIPVYSDEWTDFNPSDPGITLLELFAWIAEMDIYQINRIPDRHKRKFLELIGVIPEPPRPAQTGLAFTVSGPDPVSIPAGTELVATHIAAIQTSDGAVLQDVTAMLTGNGLPPFGAPPKINSAIYLGFDAPLPADRTAEIELRFAPAPPGPAPTAVIAWEFLDHLGVWSALAVDDSTSMLSIDGRIRITGVPHSRAVALGQVARPLYYIRARYTGGSFHPGIKVVGASETGFTTSNLVFRTVDDFTAAPGTLQAIQTSDGTTFRDFTATFPGEPLWPFGVPPVLDAAIYFGLDQPLPPKHIASLMFHFAAGAVTADAGCCHHSASTVWEYLNTFGWWATLQVDDSTRSFSADGEARMAAPAKMRKSAIGRVAAPLFYIRARHDGGEYDMPPKLLSVAWNAVEAEQARAVTQEWPIAPGTIASGAAPGPGDAVSVLFGFNAADQIDSISFDPEAEPEFWVVKYTAAGATTAGVIILELLLVAAGTGGPGQHALLASGSAVVESTVRLYSLENGAWRTWAMRLTFDSSAASDSHFLLDAQTGDVQFGDGNRGRVLPENALLFASYSKTAAALGTPEPGLRMTSAIAGLGSIQCVLPAQAGVDAESLGSAIGRAVSGREAPLRAITLGDYETLARSTPGTSIARVAARANFYPDLDAFEALGIVTVIVVPNIPVPMPRPSAGLLYAVRRYLNARRTIGTRVEVVGPTYLQVAVSATVQSGKGQNQTRLKQAILDALNYFLDPLTGGPDRTGWPFGRDVYETEILQVLAQSPGVDHVKNLALIPAGCAPSCGNICVKPNWLVTPGEHQIEVL